jgi:hypothetical protein
MPDDQILRMWEHTGLKCVLWRDSDAVLKGAVIRSGEAIATVDVLSRLGQPEAERIVESLAATLREPRGPWLIDDEPVTDLVMAECPGQLRGDEMTRLERPFALARDLRVLPVSGTMAEVLYKACDPPGIGKGFSIDLRGRPLYAFARLNAPRKPLYKWDSDERLQICIGLSRLVRPTSLSLHYAVRVLGALGSDRYAVYPGPVRGFGAQAWTSTPERDWLSLDDFHALRELIAAWDAHPFERKSRLARAYWYHEYAGRTRLVDVRWSLVSTAIETLVGTSGDRSTQGFIRRVPLLAAAAGLPPISNTEARRMWGLRSALVHGEKYGGLAEEDLALYRRMEDVLRLTLRHALTDLDFRARFASPAAVDAAFPLPAPAPKTAICPQCAATFALPSR